MARGLGLAAVRECIRKSFLEVHKDQRTREQREADEEMLRSIQTASTIPQAKTEVDSLVEQSNILKNCATERCMNAYVSAALRSPHVAKQTARRGNVNQTWVVETPAEDSATLIEQALRQLGDK
jgi:hypothetical protein